MLITSELHTPAITFGTAGGGAGVCFILQHGTDIQTVELVGTALADFTTLLACALVYTPLDVRGLIKGRKDAVVLPKNCSYSLANTLYIERDYDIEDLERVFYPYEYIELLTDQSSAAWTGLTIGLRTKRGTLKEYRVRGIFAAGFAGVKSLFESSVFALQIADKAR